MAVSYVVNERVHDSPPSPGVSMFAFVQVVHRFNALISMTHGVKSNAPSKLPSTARMRVAARLLGSHQRGAARWWRRCTRARLDGGQVVQVNPIFHATTRWCIAVWFG